MFVRLSSWASSLRCFLGSKRFQIRVFVEDTALVFSDAAILLRPGAPTRRGEADEMREVLERQF